jgi:hypothetical protein
MKGKLKCIRNTMKEWLLKFFDIINLNDNSARTLGQPFFLKEEKYEVLVDLDCVEIRSKRPI